MKTFSGFILLLISLIILPIIGIPAIIVGVFREKKDLFKYFKTIAITIDQVGSAVLYGVEDFTVSSWTHYRAKQGNIEAIVFEQFINLLASPFQKNHCEESYNNEIKELKEYKDIEL